MSVQPISRLPKRVVATASGKGGVGKTLLTANLALCMAEECAGLGQKVIAADLDLGSGNLNTCLGIRYPEKSINDFLLNRVDDLNDVLLPTPLDNLDFISGSYRGSEVIELDPVSKRRLVRAVRDLEADWVFVDLGAGSGPDVLDIFNAAEERIVITTLESVALHNCFLFLNGAMIRALCQELSQHEFLIPIRVKLLGMIEENGRLSLDQMLSELKRWDRYSSYIVHGLIAEMNFKVVVNMHRGAREEDYLEKFLRLTRKYLSKGDIQYLGSVEADDRVRQSVQAIQPFVLSYPTTDTARSLRSLARELLGEANEAEDRAFQEMANAAHSEFGPCASEAAASGM